MIPWESGYLKIKEQEVKNNTALAAYRIELMERFQPLLEKLQYAIDDPTDERLAELIEYIRSSDSMIRDAIRETRSKSKELGEANAKIIIEALENLLSVK